MRILHIVSNQTGRGTYWRAYHLGRVLAARGHAVSLMATSPTARWMVHQHEESAVRLVETPDWLPGPLRSGWDPWNTISRIDWLRRNEFDLVHAFESRPVVVYPALAARQRGSALVMDWCDWFGHGGSVEERPNPLVRTVLRPVETYFENHYRTRADGTTAINTLLVQKAVDLGVSPWSILLLRNGSDTSQPILDVACARQAMGIAGSGPVVGFSGGTYPGDAEFMAEAFNHLRRALPDAKLLLAGNFNRPIETMVDSPSAIVRTGVLPAPQMLRYLATCDVCWLPLRDTGANRGRWPMKLNDYMAAGRPVVATDVGDLRDVIGQHSLGVVTQADPQTFADATVELLRDESRRRRLGQAARQAAEGPFSWDKLGQDLEAFYLKCMAERK